MSSTYFVMNGVAYGLALGVGMGIGPIFPPIFTWSKALMCSKANSTALQTNDVVSQTSFFSERGADISPMCQCFEVLNRVSGIAMHGLAGAIFGGIVTAVTLVAVRRLGLR